MSRSLPARHDRGSRRMLTLKRELPGILKWAIQGWRLLEKQGYFTQPKSGLASVGAMRKLASPVIEFIEGEYELDRDGEVATAQLYSDYVEWFKGTGQPGHPGNDTSFGMKLSEAFQFQKRQRGVRPRYNVYMGLRRRDLN